MKKIILAILVLVLIGLSLPASAQDEAVSSVSITATIRTYVLDAPQANAELVGIFQRDVELSAYGRDADGEWLRIMDGWVLGEVFNTVGEVGALPDATHSFQGAAVAKTFLYSGPSERWFDSLAGMGEGTPLLIIGRNEDSTWLQVPGGWVNADVVEGEGDISLLPVTPSGVIITAKTRTFILAEPDLSGEFVDVFEAGEEALAIGRSGDWLQIAQGWVSSDAVKVSGETTSLPYSGAGIQITLDARRDLRNMPFPTTPVIDHLQRGEIVTATGRNSSGNWLLTERGWIVVGPPPFHSNFFHSDVDVMSLPIVEGNTSSNAVSVRATATPRATSRTISASSWNASTIRTLVSRHTDDIRILDIETAGNATTIEYDLKPWPFVPNEQIANEVAFKIICALRKGQQIPNTLKLIGQGHFKSDIGRKFKSPSVEIHIRANTANRLVCTGNDYSDINWRSVSSLYKSYPIPRGASVDYD